MALIALTLGAGCTTRSARCEAFVAAADACFIQAGEDPFFAENVDCDSPVSSRSEYNCLQESYLRAVDNNLCADREAAELIVDFSSLTCLGWSGSLSTDDDDDDSGDGSGDDDSGDDDSAR